MVRPPAVTWDVKPARWHGAVVGLLLLFAALLLIGFAARQSWGISSAALLVAFALAILFSRNALHAAPSGKLNWDGERWHWSGWEDSEVTALVCALDLQNSLLVQLAGESSAKQWLWLESQSPGNRWNALRRAVVVGSAMARSLRAGEAQGVPADLRP